jgi:8-oxo-dGTP pyrophosphatase MutT (NUDIX family)
VVQPRGVIVPAGLYNLSVRQRFAVTVHLFFFRQDQVLLSRRLNTGYRDGEYSVPAGHLEGGETVIAAAVREAHEEVGVQLRPEDVLFCGVMHRLEDEERVDFFVRVRSWSPEPFNNEPDKCDDLCWVDLTSLPANTVPYVRQALHNYLHGQIFAEFGWADSR